SLETSAGVRPPSRSTPCAPAAAAAASCTGASRLPFVTTARRTGGCRFGTARTKGAVDLAVLATCREPEQPAASSPAARRRGSARRTTPKYPGGGVDESLSARRPGLRSGSGQVRILLATALAALV